MECKIEFTAPYICKGSNKVIKRCKECDYLFKMSQRLFDDKLDYSLLFIRIEAYIRNYKYAPKYIHLIKDLKISTLTFQKCMQLNNSSFQKLLDKFNLKPVGRSKFQHSVYLILKNYYPDILQEFKVNNRFIDFYIPSINTAIECDGEQHVNPDNYFNLLAKKSGYKNAIESDIEKEIYCKKHGITLLRIPYKYYITKEYVNQHIKLKEPNAEGQIN